MLIITALVFSLPVQNPADYISDLMTMDVHRTIASVWGYSVHPVILIMFLQIDWR